MRSNNIGQFMGIYEKEERFQGENGQAIIIKKRGIEIERFTTFACFFLCIFTFISSLIFNSDVAEQLSKMSFSAFLGSIPGAAKTAKEIIRDKHPSENNERVL